MKFTTLRGMLVLLAVPAFGQDLGQDIDDQNRRVIEAMTAEQRDALLLKQDEFIGLPEEERNRLEALHAELRADAVAGGSLNDTLRRYLALLGTLSDEQRARLREQSDPAARVSELRRIAAEREAGFDLNDGRFGGRPGGGLPPLAEIAFEEVTRGSYFPREVREAAEQQPPPERHLTIVREATRDGEVTRLDRWLSDDTLGRVARRVAEIAPDRAGRFDERDPEFLRWIAARVMAEQLRREWVERAWEKLTQDLQNYFLSLPDDTQRELLSLDDDRRRGAVLYRYLDDPVRRESRGELGEQTADALRLARTVDPSRFPGRGGPRGPGGDPRRGFPPRDGERGPPPRRPRRGPRPGPERRTPHTPRRTAGRSPAAPVPVDAVLSGEKPPIVVHPAEGDRSTAGRRGVVVAASRRHLEGGRSPHRCGEPWRRDAATTADARRLASRRRTTLYHVARRLTERPRTGRG